jgi:hypothetical protein
LNELAPLRIRLPRYGQVGLFGFCRHSYESSIAMRAAVREDNIIIFLLYVILHV